MFVFVLKSRNRIYSETPEEQGLGDGPRLVRAFAARPEAVNYLDAVNAYAGIPLEIGKIHEGDLIGTVRRTAFNTRVELARMPNFSAWPKTARVILDTDVTGKD